MTATLNRTAHHRRDHPLTPLTADEIDARARTAHRRGPRRRRGAVRLRRARGAAKATVQAFRVGDPIDRARPGAAAGPRHRESAPTWSCRVTERPGRLPAPSSMQRTTATCRSSTRSSRTSSRSCSTATSGSRRCASVSIDPARGARGAVVGRRVRPRGRGGPPHRAGAGVPTSTTSADLPWAHPIDGVVAYVDLTERTVVEVDRRDRAAGARRARRVGRRTARGADPHRPQADRDHPARGRQLHRRRQPDHAGRTGSSGSASTSARG